MYPNCPYCELDTAGNHAPDCPYDYTIAKLSDQQRNPPIVMSDTGFTVGSTIKEDIDKLSAAISRLAEAIEAQNNLLPKPLNKKSSLWDLEVGKINDKEEEEPLWGPTSFYSEDERGLCPQCRGHGTTSICSRCKGLGRI